MREIGFGPAELAPVADSDRQKVRKAMLGESQLDAARFPEIRAELLVRKGGGTGRRIRPPGPPAGHHPRQDDRARSSRALRSERDWVLAEAWGEPLFSTGIEPYSAVLGAVKNQDRIHLYIRRSSRRPPESAPRRSRRRPSESGSDPAPGAEVALRTAR
ncbi:MAG: hypothetical protein R2862_04475 [Thermoanaerobaculia bacterium]